MSFVSPGLLCEQAYELVAPRALRPHPRNPRRGDVDAIEESIAENGFYGCVVAQRSTGYILAGNHRWKAAKRAKIERVPVVWLDVDDQRALRILLVDNRTNDLADYADSRLAALLSELRADSGLRGTGYDEDFHNKLLSRLAPAPAGDARVIPESLILAPTWNRVRTVAFLSVRKWASDVKHEQCRWLRERKDAGDAELAKFAATDCAQLLSQTFKSFAGWHVTCPAGSRSLSNGHFAWRVAGGLAELLGIPAVQMLDSAPKRTKSVHELEAKRTAILKTELTAGNVILFDDVATTGTTLEYAAKALERFTVLPIAWIYQDAKPL